MSAWRHHPRASDLEREIERLRPELGPEVKRAIAPKALDRFKRRVREITRGAKASAWRRRWRNWHRAKLFRILRNARGADWLDSLGTVATQGGFGNTWQEQPRSEERTA